MDAQVTRLGRGVGHGFWTNRPGRGARIEAAAGVGCGTARLLAPSEKRVFNLTGAVPISHVW